MLIFCKDVHFHQKSNNTLFTCAPVEPPTDFNVITGRLYINVISREFTVCICNTTNCVKTVVCGVAMLKVNMMIRGVAIISIKFLNQSWRTLSEMHSMKFQRVTLAMF